MGLFIFYAWCYFLVPINWLFTFLKVVVFDDFDFAFVFIIAFNHNRTVSYLLMENPGTNMHSTTQSNPKRVGFLYKLQPLKKNQTLSTITLCEKLHNLYLFVEESLMTFFNTLKSFFQFFLIHFKVNHSPIQKEHLTMRLVQEHPSQNHNLSSKHFLSFYLFLDWMFWDFIEIMKIMQWSSLFTLYFSNRLIKNWETNFMVLFLTGLMMKSFVTFWKIKNFLRLAFKIHPFVVAVFSFSPHEVS